MKEVNCQAPFMQWFTADGFFVAKPFQKWLAASIPIIGEADPKSLAEDTGKTDVQAGSVQAPTTEDVATSAKRDGGKRRKG